MEEAAMTICGMECPISDGNGGGEAGLAGARGLEGELLLPLLSRMVS